MTGILYLFVKFLCLKIFHCDVEGFFNLSKLLKVLTEMCGIRSNLIDCTVNFSYLSSYTFQPFIWETVIWKSYFKLLRSLASRVFLCIFTHWILVIPFRIELCNLKKKKVMCNSTLDNTSLTVIRHHGISRQTGSFLAPRWRGLMSGFPQWLWIVSLGFRADGNLRGFKFQPHLTDVNSWPFAASFPDFHHSLTAAD